MPLMGNKLLVVAAIVELAIAAVFLLLPPVAEVLGHQSPTGAGWAIALGAIPLILVADAIHKFVRRAKS
jgi:hypothetical protein